MTAMTAVPRAAGMPLMAESPGVWMLTDEELKEINGGGSSVLQSVVRGSLLMIYGLQARLLSREEVADFMVEHSALITSELAIVGGVAATAAWLTMSDEEKREVGRWVWDHAVSF
ncbi:MAG: hypothetical protein Q4F31_10250 [Eubacteriales bacterium]|nr:hypothetical protein [Eubacteriales bacterium]